MGQFYCCTWLYMYMYLQIRRRRYYLGFDTAFKFTKCNFVWCFFFSSFLLLLQLLMPLLWKKKSIDNCECVLMSVTWNILRNMVYYPFPITKTYKIWKVKSIPRIEFQFREKKWAPNLCSSRAHPTDFRRHLRSTTDFFPSGRMGNKTMNVFF